MPGLRLFASLLETTSEPGAWAALRETEGWDGVSVADHVFIETQPTPHVWVAATEMALATSRITISTAFANNLVRSPVEFAQAALTLQRASKGRFEAGLGAGWDQLELDAIGVRFPPTADERAGRYIEAAKVVRQLFDNRQASFAGQWYTLNVERIGPDVPVPPPLVVSVGGPRTTTALTPIADVIELKLPGFATTGKGSIYPRDLANVTLDSVAARVAEIRALRPDAVIGMIGTAGCGDEPVVQILRRKLDGSILAGLFGHPEKVAATVRAFAALGISRIGFGAVTPSTFASLAPYLPAMREE